jgi:hypothetical protein
MRPRAADDVETIRARLQELRKEREDVLKGEEPVQPPCDTEQDTQDYACGLPSWAVEPQRRMFEELKSRTPSAVNDMLRNLVRRQKREPGEFTDGA